MAPILVAIIVCILSWPLLRAYKIDSDRIRYFHVRQTPSCASPIYCRGRLLDTVQRSLIFNDSKTFVDMKTVHSVKDTIQNFDALMAATENHPQRTDIARFVSENFRMASNEFANWTLPDYTENPPFLNGICDGTVRKFASDLVRIWPQLGRRIRTDVASNPDQYSLMFAEHGFVIPGGRFREFYYWDSYWIIEGLLISGMDQTARGILDNFFDMIKMWGFVPNGARIYYLNRSQPPLLTHMVAAYINHTGNLTWLRENIHLLEKEMQFWLRWKMITITKDQIEYTLAFYNVDSPSPRPESYVEDLLAASSFTNRNDKDELYSHLKSAAESGWDFSSRWFLTNGTNKGNISSVRTRHIIPVDLNAFLCRNFYLLSDLYGRLNDNTKSLYWRKLYKTFRRTINELLYDSHDGIWYDFDIRLGRLRRFYYASNFAPLWAQCYDEKAAVRLSNNAAKYFQQNDLDQYPGGVPTSLEHTGEQWDFPNAWAPLQAIIIFGFWHIKDASEGQKIALNLTQKWIRANRIGWETTGQMYEKYDVNQPGSSGNGGEYVAQAGFGWTNGVALQLIREFYTCNYGS